VREVLYSILTEFDIPLELVRLIKMTLNETFIILRIGYNMSGVFPVQNGLKEGAALSSLLFNLCYILLHQEGSRKSGRTGSE